MTTRIGIDFGTANTVVARWDDDRDVATPIALDGVDLLRPGADGVQQRVVPSLMAYSHRDDHRWLGAQVVERPELLDDPSASVFRSTKTSVAGRAADIPRMVGDRKVTGRMTDRGTGADPCPT